MDSFPEVMIVPDAKALGGAIQTRFIVWGLWIGMVGMIERNRFRTAIFTLKWEGVPVGYLSIARPGALANVNGINHTESFIMGSHTVRSNATDSVSQISSGVASERLAASFDPTGPSLVANDVLMSVLYGLTYMAHFPKTQRLDTVELSLPAPYNMHLVLTGTYLVPNWVILTLKQIPAFMIQARRFSGLRMNILVNGALIGQGRIVKNDNQA